jgi:hypothetical protein
LVASGESEPEHRETGHSEGLGRMTCLSGVIVGRHALPTSGPWMGVEESDAAPRFCCFPGGPEEIVAFETHIAMEVAVSVCWPDWRAK